MTDLDKIRKLLERAAHGSTPVEEARTSAVIAAKLIIEHEVELRLPRPSSPSIEDLMSQMFRDFSIRHRDRVRDFSTRPVRQMFVALCPPNLELACSCCRAPIRHGSNMYWVGNKMLVDEEAGTIARVVHETCVDHWGSSRCRACQKRTDGPRSTRERIKNHVRDPQGTTLAKSVGYCFCCGGLFDIDEKVVVRGLVVVHYRCSNHFNQKRCSKCGGGF